MGIQIQTFFLGHWIESAKNEWLAYQDARKAPIRAQRAERYKTTTDPLFMAAMEESTTLFDAVEQVYNVKVDKTYFWMSK